MKKENTTTPKKYEKSKPSLTNEESMAQIKLHPAQEDIVKDTHRFRVLDCGRRFGKTTVAIEEMYGKLLAKQSRVCYIAPTFQQARDIAWVRLILRMKPAIANINESRLEVHVKNLEGTTSLCILRGWEAIETLRGQQFDFIVIDEVATMRDFLTGWEQVVSPTLTDTKGEVLFISTPKGFNAFYTLYNFQEKDSDFKSFKYTSYDNPYIPKEEIDRQEKTLPEDSFSQEYLADFRKRTGLVYPEFNRDKHVFNPDERKGSPVSKLVGVDFGYTNPTAILYVERDGDDNFWVMWEWYRTQKTNTEVVDYVKTIDYNKVYPDPAEPARIEEMRRAGINVQEVSKDITKGCDSVRELIKTNRLHVSSDCPNLLAELEMYHYPDKRINTNEPEKPVKEDDHGVDALRYILHNVGSMEERVAYTFTPNRIQNSKTRLVKSSGARDYNRKMPRKL